MTTRTNDGERSTVERGSARIAVSRWGDTGSSMVLLHPGVGDRRAWRWCAPSWAGAGFRVIAPDRRGFGDTEYQPEPHDDVDDLVAVCDATAADPATVVGNSRGGEIALEYALRCPERVTALVLIAPFVNGYDLDGWEASEGEEALDERIAAASEAGDLDEVNRLELHYWLDGADQAEGRVRGDARALMDEMNGRALRASPPGDTPARTDLWSRLGEIACPALVLVGEYDLPGLVRHARELADVIPTAEFEVIAGAAHCPSLDQPDALTATILRFARSVSVLGPT
jgi:pimeloyl-ACP methyl ester carboxylesterase